MSRPAALSVLALAGLAFNGAAEARAQELRTNDFRVDLTPTPVLASGKVLGVGGAYTALAEGIASAPFNAAAYGARARWELDRFEWEPAFSLLLGGSFRENDFFNNGLGEGFGVDDFTFFDVGLRFQLGDVGFGVLVQSQRYGLPDADPTDELVDPDARFRTAHAGLGYGFFRGQLVVGGGVRWVTLRFDAEDASGMTQPLVDFEGAGFDVGMLLRIDGLPFRFGAGVRTPVRSTVVEDPGEEIQTVLGLPLPRSVELPWEVRTGVAWQFGPRRFNPRYVRRKDAAHGWAERLARERCARRGAGDGRAGAACEEPPDPELTPEDRVAGARQASYAGDAMAGLRALGERVRASEPRRYVLVSTEVLLQGSLADAVGVDAFVRQEQRRRGRKVTFGWRLGVEGEPWHDRLRVRAGTYLEPSRYDGVNPRVHGTAGFDVRLFRVWRFDLQAGFTIDGARDYLNWGFGLGVWH
ncbi:MAG: hypothetical protein AAGH15_12395 [Myxococcota bacterium]